MALLSNNPTAIDAFEKAQQLYHREKFIEANILIEQYKERIEYNDFKRIDNRDSKTPVVSVIIVAYNTRELLVDCLNSVLKQEINQHEIIVVDNGLNNSVHKKIAELPVLHIICPINFVLAEGRNIATHFARGEILAFLDDDALVQEDYISSILKAFKGDLVGFRGKVIPKTEDAYQNSSTHYDLGNEAFPYINNTEGNSAVLHEAWIKTGGQDPLLFGGEGLESSCKIAAEYGINSFIYWPETIIKHDYATTADKKKAKHQRHEFSAKYIKHKWGALYKWCHSFPRQLRRSSTPVPKLAVSKDYSVIRNRQKKANFSLIIYGENLPLKADFSQIELVVVSRQKSKDSQSDLYVHIKDNCSQNTLMNTAAAESSGEVIMFCWEDTVTVELLSQHMQAHNEQIIAAGSIGFENEQLPVLPYKENLSIRRKAFCDAGGWSPSLNESFASAVELMWKICQAGHSMFSFKNIRTVKTMKQDTYGIDTYKLLQQMEQIDSLFRPFFFLCVAFDTKLKEKAGIQPFCYDKELNKKALAQIVMESSLIKASKECRKIAIYGAGEHSRKCQEILENSPVSLAGFIDDSPASIRGTLPVHELHAYLGKIDGIVISSDTYENEIYNKIKSLEIRIYRPYADHEATTSEK